MAGGRLFFFQQNIRIKIEVVANALLMLEGRFVDG